MHMTYEYSDIDPLEALYSRAMEYGVERLASDMSRRMGKQVSPVVLRHKLRHEVKTHQLALEEFSVITELLEAHSDADAKMPLRALCWRHGMLAIAVPVDVSEVTPKDIMAQVGDLASEFGDVIQEVTTSTADRRITPKERQRIQLEAEQLAQALMRLCRSIDAVTESEEGDAQ
jgi:hypothetical protein